MDNKNDLFDLENYNPKKLDTSIKRGVQQFAKNMASFIAAACAVVVIATTFFDITIAEIFGWHFLADAVLTVILFLAMQFSLEYNGIANGKTDPEYVAAREQYLAIRDRVRAKGSPMLDEFCDMYVAKELESVRRGLLSHTPVKYEIWQEHFADLEKREIRKLPKNFKYTYNGRERVLCLNKKTKAVLILIDKIDEISLNPDMLLIDNASGVKRGALSKAAEKWLKKKNYGLVAKTSLAGTFAVSIAFTLLTGFGPEALMYIAMKIFLIFYRGFVGYSTGYIAYAVHGTKYYDSQINILSQYEGWVREQSEKGAEADNILTTQDSLNAPF